MAKNPRRTAPAASRSAAPPPVFSKRGKKTLGIGIGVILVGFLVLSWTDPAGQNWASRLSPFLLIAGYTTVGIGIVLKDPESGDVISSPLSTPKK